MSRNRVIVSVARACLVLLLGGVGLAGLYNTYQEWPDAATALQHVVSAGELIYGLTGVAGASGVVRNKRWTLAVVAVWGIAVTLVASLATLAYGGPTVTSGDATIAGAASFAIALVVFFGARAVTGNRGSD
ncbi:MAG TPA: hypothetical protein VM939_12435 [Gemmatimonadaceae bacterium]|nr:hypothetical protein [Gemmatimonadaceae bacterium]